MSHETHRRRPCDRQTASTSRRPVSIRVFRTAAILLVLLTCLRVWTGAEPLIERAQAQIPDSGHQRKLLLDEARKSNQLLTEIAQILRERTLNVRLAPADNQAAAPVPRRVRP